MLNVFYGCAYRHRPIHKNINVYTFDIDPKTYCSQTGDIREILKNHESWLTGFDGLIFTPPCNYYSRANWRRESSDIAQKTKDLLPLCLDFCVAHGLPFLVENVQNSTLLKDLYPKLQFVIGGHTFWSNILQAGDFVGLICPKQNKQYVNREKRNGNWVVDFVIHTFLERVSETFDDFVFDLCG